jgi:predicted small secreted protein
MLLPAKIIVAAGRFIRNLLARCKNAVRGAGKSVSAV